MIGRVVRLETRGLEKAAELNSEGECHCGSHLQPKRRVVGHMVWKSVNIQQHNFSKDILLITIVTGSTHRRLSMLLLLQPYSCVCVMIAITSMHHRIGNRGVGRTPCICVHLNGLPDDLVLIVL